MVKKRTIALASALLILFAAVPAFAEHRDFHGGGRDFRGYEHGRIAHRIPPGFRSFFWRDIEYLFCDGLYYRYSPVGYVIVSPPPGAVIPVLPGGTYYTTAPGGYQVVTPPPAAEAAPAENIQPERTEEIGSYEIHIPNRNGSSTVVVLKKKDKGFVGPQGEFYAEHPTVEQLKERYAKE